jgi:S-adenosylmethionine:tRNA-ribosyltransferase-isomerase (queuine synthetase)
MLLIVHTPLQSFFGTEFSWRKTTVASWLQAYSQIQHKEYVKKLEFKATQTVYRKTRGKFGIPSESANVKMRDGEL